MEHNKLVYIASPYSGDVERNVAFAKAACRYAMNQGVTPIASHLLYPQMLDDGVPEERKLGTDMGLRILKVCEEVWVCGSELSSGMEQEIRAASSFRFRLDGSANRRLDGNYVKYRYKREWRWADDDTGQPV